MQSHTNLLLAGRLRGEAAAAAGPAGRIFLRAERLCRGRAGGVAGDPGQKQPRPRVTGVTLCRVTPWRELTALQKLCWSGGMDKPGLLL